MNRRRIEYIAGVLFVIGVLAAVLLAGAASWGDFEGLSYFRTGASHERFDGLRCPILIAPGEQGTLTATFVNTSNEAIQPYYEASVSGVPAIRNIEGQITVPARSSREVSWQVSTNDVDLGFFVLSRFLVLPFGGHATREATCGMLAVHFAGLSGRQILSLWLAVSLLCLLAGMVLPVIGLSEGEARRYDREAISNPRRAAQAVGITAAAAMFTGIAGWWLAGFVLGAISLLLLLIVFGSLEQ